MAAPRQQSSEHRCQTVPPAVVCMVPAAGRWQARMRPTFGKDGLAVHCEVERLPWTLNQRLLHHLNLHQV